LHPQRFVRTLLVVLLAEAIEGALLGPPVGRRRLRRLLLQVPKTRPSMLMTLGSPTMDHHGRVGLLRVIQL